jgi:MHS family proline/betaine transporter-like MFS transporter
MGAGRAPQLYGRLQQCSSAMGFLLGSGMAAATASFLAADATESWGWRIPFLIGGIIWPCRRLSAQL